MIRHCQINISSFAETNILIYIFNDAINIKEVYVCLMHLRL